ncbi:hypothetical protein JCM8097_000731 [Rhodosporidiobolus ruineniae]
MAPIKIDDQVLPPSLLPVLHDCLHHRPPLWFAELEELYQGIDNMRELSRSVSSSYIELCKRATSRNLGWRRMFGLRKPIYRMDREEQKVDRRYYRWLILVEARAKYAGYHTLPGKEISGFDSLDTMFKLEVENDVKLKEMMARLPALGLTEAQRAHLARIPLTEAYQHLGERLGGGKEEDWLCSKQSISAAHKKRIMQTIEA